MINSITITNPLGQSVEMVLRNPELSGFLIKRIDGLGPNPATINATELASKDGALYNSARVLSRNIVFSLQMLDTPTKSAEELRHDTYTYFPIKKRIDILIEADHRTCRTYGYVESNSLDIFSKAVTTYISVMCPDAYFYANTQTLTLFSGVDSQFEFPFSNESLTVKAIEFGIIEVDEEKSIIYTGDANVVILIYIHAIGSVEGVTIHNALTSESMTIDTDKLETLTGDVIIAGDDIIISTIKGEKFIYLLRAGNYVNILSCLDVDSDWFELTPGDNVFVYAAEVGASYLQFQVIHSTLYEGV